MKDLFGSNDDFLYVQSIWSPEDDEFRSTTTGIESTDREIDFRILLIYPLDFFWKSLFLNRYVLRQIPDM